MNKMVAYAKAATIR